MILLLLVLWWVFLLYGLVYLLVDSDLLACPREWFTSAVSLPEDAAIAILLADAAPEPVSRTTSSSQFQVFVGRVLSCWQCTAGWVALPAAGLVVLFALALHYDALWAISILAILMVPPTGIGFVTLMEHFSPKRASENVVNAMTDIAQAVLAAKQASENPSPHEPKKV
jgi:hypothetical protein